MDIYDWLLNYGVESSQIKTLMKNIELFRPSEETHLDVVSIVHDLSNEEIEKLNSNKIPVIKI